MSRRPPRSATHSAAAPISAAATPAALKARRDGEVADLEDVGVRRQPGRVRERDSPATTSSRQATSVPSSGTRPLKKGPGCLGSGAGLTAGERVAASISRSAGSSVGAGRADLDGSAHRGVRHLHREARPGEVARAEPLAGERVVVLAQALAQERRLDPPRELGGGFRVAEADEAEPEHPGCVYPRRPAPVAELPARARGSARSSAPRPRPTTAGIGSQ